MPQHLAYGQVVTVREVIRSHTIIELRKNGTRHLLAGSTPRPSTVSQSLVFRRSGVPFHEVNDPDSKSIVNRFLSIFDIGVA